jgi:hypothetical protein
MILFSLVTTHIITRNEKQFNNQKNFRNLCTYIIARVFNYLSFYPSPLNSIMWDFCRTVASTPWRHLIENTANPRQEADPADREHRDLRAQCSGAGRCRAECHRRADISQAIYLVIFAQQIRAGYVNSAGVQPRPGGIAGFLRCRGSDHGVAASDFFGDGNGRAASRRGPAIKCQSCLRTLVPWFAAARHRNLLLFDIGLPRYRISRPRRSL